MIKVSIPEREIQRALRNINTYAEEVKKGIKDQVTLSAYAIEKEAKERVKTDDGILKNSIHASNIAPYTSEVRVNAHYAPYVEFGTGDLVKVPAGLESYAMQFKGRGIKKINLPARPYLFPAFEAEKNKFLAKAAKILKLR